MNIPAFAAITLVPTLSAAAAVRLYALGVLKHHEGDRHKTAAALDVDPSTLRRWLADLERSGAAIPAGPKRTGRPRKAINVSIPGLA